MEEAIQNQEALEKLLASVTDLLAAYLFGSRARGDQGKQSDYDFAFLFPRELHASSRSGSLFRTAGELSILLGTDKIDALSLNDTDSLPLKYAVIREGRLLFTSPGRSAEVEEYERKVSHEYFDHMATLYRLGIEEKEPSDGKAPL